MLISRQKQNKVVSELGVELVSNFSHANEKDLLRMKVKEFLVFRDDHGFPK